MASGIDRVTADESRAMMGIGFQELLVVFAIIVLIFGASKLPQLGRGLGEGIRNFRKGLKKDEAGEIEGKQSPTE